MDEKARRKERGKKRDKVASVERKRRLLIDDEDDSGTEGVVPMGEKSVAAGAEKMSGSQPHGPAEIVESGSGAESVEGQGLEDATKIPGAAIVPADKSCDNLTNAESSDETHHVKALDVPGLEGKNNNSELPGVESEGKNANFQVPELEMKKGCSDTVGIKLSQGMENKMINESEGKNDIVEPFPTVQSSTDAETNKGDSKFEAKNRAELPPTKSPKKINIGSSQVSGKNKGPVDSDGKKIKIGSNKDKKDPEKDAKKRSLETPSTESAGKKVKTESLGATGSKVDGVAERKFKPGFPEWRFERPEVRAGRMVPLKHPEKHELKVKQKESNSKKDHGSHYDKKKHKEVLADEMPHHKVGADTSADARQGEIGDARQEIRKVQGKGGLLKILPKKEDGHHKTEEYQKVHAGPSKNASVDVAASRADTHGEKRKKSGGRKYEDSREEMSQPKHHDTTARIKHHLKPHREAGTSQSEQSKVEQRNSSKLKGELKDPRREKSSKDMVVSGKKRGRPVKDEGSSYPSPQKKKLMAGESRTQKGRNKVKHEVREQIKNMLLNAGWKIELRPRRGKAYEDSVYVSPKGTGYWSITKAYAVYRADRGDDAPTKETSGGDDSIILKDDLEMLKRNVVKKRRNKRDLHGDKKHGVSIKKRKDRAAKADEDEEPDEPATKKRKDRTTAGADEEPEEFVKKKKKDRTITRENDEPDERGKGKDSGKKKKGEIHRVADKHGDEKMKKKGLAAVRPRKENLADHADATNANHQGFALVVRGAAQSSKDEKDDYSPYQWKRTILSWVIDAGVVVENSSVKYMNKRRNKILQEGRIRREGIYCYCCSKILSLSKFEVHAGSKENQPYDNIFLADEGVSLLQCLLKAWKKQVVLKNKGYYVVDGGADSSDDTCGICGDGGDLICCDGCPSTFHLTCLGVQMLPPGDWYCRHCICRFCSLISPKTNQEDEASKIPLLSCMQCGQKYHEVCIPTNRRDSDYVDADAAAFMFCGRNCRKVFVGLQDLLGVQNQIDGGYSWSLIRRIDENSPESQSNLSLKVECNAKIAVANAVMNECFVPIIDRGSGINLIHNVIYNCGSNFHRLDYRGFYTFILERGDEIISVASVRIHGTRIAEMPFVGTRYIYRHQGMMRRLLGGIEMALHSFNVRKLLVPAVDELKKTWIEVFGFKPLEGTRNLQNLNLLVFHDTGFLEKSLGPKQPADGHISARADEKVAHKKQQTPKKTGDEVVHLIAAQPVSNPPDEQIARNHMDEANGLISTSEKLPLQDLQNLEDVTESSKIGELTSDHSDEKDIHEKLQTPITNDGGVGSLDAEPISKTSEGLVFDNALNEGNAVIGPTKEIHDQVFRSSEAVTEKSKVESIVSREAINSDAHIPAKVVDNNSDEQQFLSEKVVGCTQPLPAEAANSGLLVPEERVSNDGPAVEGAKFLSNEAVYNSDLATELECQLETPIEMAKSEAEPSADSIDPIIQGVNEKNDVDSHDLSTLVDPGIEEVSQENKVENFELSATLSKDEGVDTEKEVGVGSVAVGCVCIGSVIDSVVAPNVDSGSVSVASQYETSGQIVQNGQPVQAESTDDAYPDPNILFSAEDVLEFSGLNFENASCGLLEDTTLIHADNVKADEFTVSGEDMEGSLCVSEAPGTSANLPDATAAAAGNDPISKEPGE